MADDKVSNLRLLAAKKLGAIYTYPAIGPANRTQIVGKLQDLRDGDKDQDVRTQASLALS